jgi:hypothetical protein
MPRRQGDTTAAALLGTWTDSDTAMQIVGTSLGIFGPDRLDPQLALAHETPLRNALFDALLSLVEGGALDMRPTDDGLYAFRWRPDYAIAGLTSETSTAIDIPAPSPYLAELTQVRRERDDALGRAQFAEALATERERLLRLAPAPNTKRRAAPRRAGAQSRNTPAARERSAPDARHVSSHDRDEVQEIDLRAYAVNRDTIVLEEPVIDAADETPAAVPAKPAAVRRVTKPRAKPKTNVDPPKPSKAKATTARAAKTTRTPKPKAVASSDVAQPPEVDADERTVFQPTAEETDVVYLTQSPTDPEAGAVAIAEADQLEDESLPRRAKWSGYTLDKPRLHLSSVDRLADEG